MFLVVLRGADEHLDEVVVQAIVELALERPFKLGIVEIARMEFEVVSMDWRIGEPGPDDHFDRFAFDASVKLHKRMLVEAELLLHPG